MLNNSFAERIMWDDCRESIGHSSPEAQRIIDNISPGKKFPLYRIRYPFGEHVAKNGLLRLPDLNNKFHYLGSDNLQNQINDELSYSSVPLGFATKNSLEVFQHLGNRIHPIGIIHQGLQLGIWEYGGYSTPYSITSGARSLYMVPRIATKKFHKRLSVALGIESTPPKRAIDQWNTFISIANSPYIKDKWYSEIIFLTKPWLEQLKSNHQSKSWLELDRLLLQTCWLHSGYGRKKIIFDVIWQQFANILTEKKIKLSPYSIDTFKHLMFISFGEIPGFAPYDGKNTLGPLDSVQNAYLDYYNLEGYCPTILQPQHFSKKRPCYYSFQLPTLMETIPKLKYSATNLDEIRGLQELIEKLYEFPHKVIIKYVPIQQTINSTNFNFYHSELYAQGKRIKSTLHLPKEDPRFLYNGANKANLKFASYGSFMQGCIGISVKEY